MLARLISPVLTSLESISVRSTAVDYVPELLEDGHRRAAAESLDVEFQLGDAEDLPAGDSSFDAVLSVFGVMFAPEYQRAVGQIARVTARPAPSPGPRGPPTASPARCSVSGPSTARLPGIVVHGPATSRAHQAWRAPETLTSAHVPDHHLSGLG